MELEKIKKIPNKKHIQQMAINDAKNMLESGEENPLLLRVQIKRMIEFLAVYDKQLDEAVRTEAELYGEKSFEFQGAKVELAEVSVRYNYSDDIEWVKIKGLIDPMTKDLKEREEFLKKLTKPIDTIDKDTGEVITIRPAAKSSKSSVKITL